MIYSKDRKYEFATSNYRESVNSYGVRYISVDFYTADIPTEKDWILYHNGTKILYCTHMDVVEQQVVHTSATAQRVIRIWVRLNGIFIDSEESAQLVENLKAAEKREIQEAKEATRLREYAEQLRQQILNTDTGRESLARTMSDHLRTDDTVKQDIKPMEPEKTTVEPQNARDFSNLLLDE